MQRLITVQSTVKISYCIEHNDYLNHLWYRTHWMGRLIIIQSVLKNQNVWTDFSPLKLHDMRLACALIYLCHTAVSLPNYTTSCLTKTWLLLRLELFLTGEPHPRYQLLQLSSWLLLRAGRPQHPVSKRLLLPRGDWPGLEGMSTGDVQCHLWPVWRESVQPLRCWEILWWGASHCCVWWDWFAWHLKSLLKQGFQ